MYPKWSIEPKKKEGAGKMKTDDVREHYEKSAVNRDSRLKTTEFNIAQYNHSIRYGVIDKLLQQKNSYHSGIDIGTGTGVWAEVLAPHCEAVVGVDFAEANIEIAKRNAMTKGLSSNIEYSLGDAQCLDGFKNGQFDIAMHVSVLQHLSNKEKAVIRISEILAPDGVLIILVHNHRCLYNRNLRQRVKDGNMLPLNEYSTMQELTALLNNTGFNVVNKRFCWLFFNDFIFAGKNQWWGGIFSPVRFLMKKTLPILDKMLGRVGLFDRLFREIVIVAVKK